MQGNRVDRRSVLKAMSAAAAVGVVAAQTQRAAAQQVKWSAGTEAPKLRAPADAADCHHHIYDAKYPPDPRSTLRPGDASARNPGEGDGCAELRLAGLKSGHYRGEEGFGDCDGCAAVA